MTIPNVSASVSIAEYTNIIGLGDYSLLGAIAGAFRFRDEHADGDEVTYIVTDGPNVEIVIGILTYSVPDTLSRVTILASSNAGNKILWSGGTRPLLREVVNRAQTISIRKITQGSSTTLTTDDYMIEVITGILANTTVNGSVGTPTTGVRYEIKDKTGLIGAYPIIFIPDGSQTVEGESSYSFNDNFGNFTITWDGNDWSIT